MLTLGQAGASRSEPARITVLAAGDIASCESREDERTSDLVARRPGTVLTLGDNAYESGTRDEFARCYAPSWGRFKSRTRPTAGNHDYMTPGAAGFRSYFGLRRTYYAFNLGGWRLYALDSERIAPAQLRWLRRDLRRNRRRCVLAYWHRPLFSSGPHGGHRPVERFWGPLHAARAEIVLNGHDHDYERFDPMNAKGAPDPRGLRQFVVGTGGKSLYPLRRRLHRQSRVFQSAVYGILKLQLRMDGYAWRFVSTSRRHAFADRGAGRCH